MVLASHLYIEAPTVTPARGGLLAVANVLEGDVHVGISGAVYQSGNCGIPRPYGDDICLSPAAPDREVKVFDPITTIVGSPFVVYKGVECQDLNDDDTAWAAGALALGESVAVERGVMGGALQGATDLTPVGGPVSLINGIAALEGWAASNYGGLATLHVPRSVATRALAREVFENSLDWTITTRQGSLVANGGGYENNVGPDGTPAPAGQAWLYITGQITLVRTPVVSNRVLAHTDNNQMALAERSYVALVECIKGAIRIALEANDG